MPEGVPGRTEEEVARLGHSTADDHDGRVERTGQAARPCPSQRPMVSKVSIDSRSPALAALVIICPVIAFGSPPAVASMVAAVGDPGRQLTNVADQRLAARVLLPAAAVAAAAQDPVGHHPDVAELPRDAERARGTARPFITIPPPIPVPSATMSRSSTSAPAPNRNSPQAAAFASFSTTTGIPTASSTSALSGSLRQARFGANSTVERSSSM